MTKVARPFKPPEAVVLLGRVVTFDGERPVIDDGALYIGADERIHGARSRTEPAPPGFDAAPRIRTRGVIYPGLMDLHNHIVYNGLSLWQPKDQAVPYTSRYKWPKDSSYEQFVSDPANALGALAGKAQLKYLETKAVIGGVTAIQGSAKTGRPYEGWLVRNVEYETFATGKKTVFQSALPLRGPKDHESRRKQLDGGGAFIYHLCEGSDLALVAEYTMVKTERLVRSRFCAVHCTALGPGDFGDWHTVVTEAEPDARGSIIWSPFSNLWLYGTTTRVDEARDAGLRICLGADWSPSGTKNLLGELKVADLCNRTLFDGAFSDRELCEMATCNPADALGWNHRLGRLRTGLHADAVVIRDRGGDPYRNLIEALEGDVLLVTINGYPFYGTPGLMAATEAPEIEPIRIGGRKRMIRLRYTGIPDCDMGWHDVLTDIARAKRDPVARYLELEKAHGSPIPEKRPVWLITDKPWDDPTIEGKPVPVDVFIPPLDPLVHDAAFFAAVAANPIHGGKLDALADYWG
jgi:5-methylthioadenosine/S-adenosylhomocysteine deaminase